MKKTLILLLMLLSLNAGAQRIYRCSWKSDADVKVYVTDWKSEADLVVYITDWSSEAYKTNRGIWHFTDWKSEADKKVYFVRWKSEADIIIYFTRYKSEAGWRRKSKEYLISG